MPVGLMTHVAQHGHRVRVRVKLRRPVRVIDVTVLGQVAVLVLYEEVHCGVGARAKETSELRKELGRGGRHCEG